MYHTEKTAHYLKKGKMAIGCDDPNAEALPYLHYVKHRIYYTYRKENYREEVARFYASIDYTEDLEIEDFVLVKQHGTGFDYVVLDMCIAEIIRWARDSIKADGLTIESRLDLIIELFLKYKFSIDQARYIVPRFIGNWKGTLTLC